MQAVCPDASVVTQVIGEIAFEVVPFRTGAGLFQAVGIDMVICGAGSIEQVYRPGEFESLDQLSQCLGMIERLIPKLAA
ncbi:MAG: hypothetical protein OSB69_20815 [Alphaproteobacteria bacterium]|nr:hypothetical protein [Alphaproteobacteria bacterium]